MPHLNHTGPEGKGSGTGRGLGACHNTEKTEFEPGQGMGKKRRSSGETGLGRRLRSSKLFD